MKPNIIGSNKKQKEGFSAFVPNKYPPKAGFNFDSKILKKDNEATRLLGKLDGITKLLPPDAADFFLLMYLRKDAASSSQIEGTMATMIDAIEAEININTNIPEDVDDILHYIQALNYGMKRMKKENFPMVLRFIRELHKKLMHKARATHFSDPGEFRKTQNWIGGTRPGNARFIPPPVTNMNKALQDLETFIHTDDFTIPTIIKSGLIHAQFETIHPFLDGNGRTGRMLITFYLWKEKFLEKPVLFLSSFFKRHQKLYYERLSDYHNGDVSKWIDFFLDGVIEIANEAIAMVDDITSLRIRNMNKIQKLSKRASESTDIVLHQLYAQPIVNLATVQKWTGFTRAGAQTVIDRLIKMNILTLKYKYKKYGQTYIFKEYIDIFTDKK
jgi:Fic family protein